MIDSIDPAQVRQNSTCLLTAHARSPSGETLIYFWRADSGGTVVDTRLDTTMYSAGKLTGLFRVDLRVLDAESRTDSSFIRVEVVGPTEGGK